MLGSAAALALVLALRHRRLAARPSMVGPELVAQGTRRLEELTVAEERAWWVESRPEARGEFFLMSCAVGEAGEAAREERAGVRSRLYGGRGGSFAVRGQQIVVTDRKTQRLVLLPGETPLTPADAPHLCFGDACIGADGWVYCVREDQSDPVPERVVHEIVAVPLDGSGDVRVLHRGHDFYAYPRLSADGRQLAWVTWDFPNMAWDRTSLWVAPVAPAGGALAGAPALVAGGGGDDEPEVAVTQPSWGPDGALYFSSDQETGFWGLHRWRDGRTEHVFGDAERDMTGITRVAVMQYAFVSPHEAVLRLSRGGRDRLVRVDVRTGRHAAEPAGPLQSFEAVAGSAASGALVVLGGGPRAAPQVRALLPAALERPLRGSGYAHPARAPVSEPRDEWFEGTDGQPSHMFVYPPSAAGTSTKPPPLLVLAHGGPTNNARPVLSPQVQFWTSRGWCVADVNYGGSAGFGRPYRERLRGQFGVVDVGDCCAAARHLAAAGAVDAQRLCIHGQSAGGFVTLAALTFHDVFHAGTSWYGIGDLEVLGRETHKLECRYLDSLTAPAARGQARLLRERSPVHRARECGPVLLLHGTADVVVPPNQSQIFFDAVKAQGRPAALAFFDGEGHGFRREENVVRAYEWEEWFFSSVLGSGGGAPAGALEVANM